MRTTVTLDSDVAQKLRDLAHRRRQPFKVILNEIIRRGLVVQERTEATEPPFRVRPVAGGFRNGIDPGKLNQLLDQLEAEDFSGEAGRES